MKKSYKYLSVVASVGLFGLAACSSDDDSSSGSAAGGADFKDSIAAYEAGPTGTLAAGEENTVATSGGQQAASQKDIGDVGALGSNVALQNVGIAKVADLGACLQKAAGSAQSTSNGQGGGSGSFSGTCACTTSGTVDLALSATTSGEQGQQQVVDATYNVKYNACSGDGKSVDGTLSYVIHQNAAKGAAGNFYIYRGDLTVTGTETKTIKFEFALINNKLTVIVKVSDGNVFFSGNYDASTKSGNWEITDKNGTWTCQATNGTGKCTHSAGQPERAITL
jgi:hypothetical protein